MIRLAEIGEDEAVREAAAVLQKGGVILYPTDTVYGLGVDTENPHALERLAALKGRREGQRFLVLVDGVDMARKYGVLSDKTTRLARRFWPGAFSIVVPRNPTAPAPWLPDYDSIGFRSPDHAFCQALVSAYGKPITSTSANLTGHEPQTSVDRVLAEIDAGMLDLVIDGGELPPSPSSTIVRVEDEGVVLLREGTIKRDEIEQT